MQTYNREQEYGLLSDITPSWLCITKRQVKEPKRINPAKKSDKNKRAIAITILDDKGVKHKFKTIGEASEFVGYTTGSGLAKALKTKNEEGYFYARRKRYKYID